MIQYWSADNRSLLTVIQNEQRKLSLLLLFHGMLKQLCSKYLILQSKNPFCALLLKRSLSYPDCSGVSAVQTLGDGAPGSPGWTCGPGSSSGRREGQGAAGQGQPHLQPGGSREALCWTTGSHQAGTTAR